MRYATPERIDEVLVKVLGLDLRVVMVGDRKFSVTFTDGEPVVICEWAELSEGQTVNGSRVWWVGRWAKETREPLAGVLLEAVAIAQGNA